MNFLAHAYLSFGVDGLLVGGMIGDFVKGNKKEAYPADIKRGIELHRAIDSYTDAHPATVEARKVFRPIAGLYAGAFVDVSFDYFLANDLHLYSPEEWKYFVMQVYRILSQNEEWMPEVFARFFPAMKQDDWLFNYRYLWAIKRSFANVVQRAKYLPHELSVLPVFERSIPQLEDCYRIFFPELEKFVKLQLAE